MSRPPTSNLKAPGRLQAARGQFSSVYMSPAYLPTPPPPSCQTSTHPPTHAHPTHHTTCTAKPQSHRLCGAMFMQVQPTTKQLEYIGEIVRCTEAIANLPAGGQVLMGAATFLRTNGRLHQLALPPELCCGPAGDRITSELEQDIASVSCLPS